MTEHKGYQWHGRHPYQMSFSKLFNETAGLPADVAIALTRDPFTNYLTESKAA